MRVTPRTTAAMAFLAALMVVTTACNASRNDGPTVEVALRDFDLTVSPDAVAPGTITLSASNDGPTTHEFELFSGAQDIDLDALPVENDVADTSGLTLVDEIENITPGSTAELNTTLEPGTYAVICNLPEHYAQGMHATLTVA